ENGCVGRSKLEGVLDEIDDDPLHASNVDFDACLVADFQAHTPPIRGRNRALERILEELRKFDPLEIQRDVFRLEVGHLEQLANHTVDERCALGDDVDRAYFLVMLSIAEPAGEKPRLQADDRQWILEVVRDVTNVLVAKTLELTAPGDVTHHRDDGAIRCRAEHDL